MTASPMPEIQPLDNILAILVIVICAYLALKVVGFLFKLAMIILAFGGLYWLASPHLGLPMPF